MTCLLVAQSHLFERLAYIGRDQFEYTIDEEDRHVQDVIMKQESTREAASVLKKTLSCSYPNLRFCEALKTENEKLQLELQRSQEHYDVAQCEFIQRLIGVTRTVVDLENEKELSKKASKKAERTSSNKTEYAYDEDSPKKTTSRVASRSTSSVLSGRDLLSQRGSIHHHEEEWHTDLLAYYIFEFLMDK